MPARVQGYRETAAAFRELTRFVSVPANAASRYALQPALAEAKANAPERTGLLRKALKIVRDARSPKLKPRYLVGPDSKIKGRNGENPARYAHLAEFGTAPHWQPKRKRMHPGTKGTRFLTHAYEQTKEQVARRFVERFGPALEKRAAQLNKPVRR